MKLRVHGATDIGLVREHNEDAFLVDRAHGFFAVADGLGGMPGGEVASQTAIATLRVQLARIPVDGAIDYHDLFGRAHSAVGIAGRAYGPTGIGTTLTAAHVRDGRATITHVGDSFALLVRAGSCRAVTREHNVENDSANRRDPGAITSNYRYALTRVIGMPEPVRADVFEERLRAGDRLLLATDGLTDLVDLDEVASVCGPETEPVESVRALVAAALERGGRDNITVVLIAIDEG